MPDHNGGTAALMLDDFSHVAREIMQRQALHRPGAAPGAARLRPQHAKARFGQSRGDLVEIFRAAAAPRQQNDQWPGTFRDHGDAHVIIGDNVPRALGLRRRRAQCDQGGRNAEQQRFDAR